MNSLRKLSAERQTLRSQSPQRRRSTTQKSYPHACIVVEVRNAKTLVKKSRFLERVHGFLLQYGEDTSKLFLYVTWNQHRYQDVHDSPSPSARSSSSPNSCHTRDKEVSFFYSPGMSIMILIKFQGSCIRSQEKRLAEFGIREEP